MRRKLFTLAAGMSAVLCVGVCVLWVRSWWVDDRLSWNRIVDGAALEYWEGSVHSMRGRMWVSTWHQKGYWDDRHARPPTNWAGLHWERESPSAPRVYEPFSYHWLCGFWGSHAPYVHQVTTLVDEWYGGRMVSFPAWVPAIVTLPLPLIGLRRSVVRRRRARRRLCVRCGYDLRASPERCPECGRDKVLV